MENFNWPLLSGCLVLLALAVIVIKMYLNHKAFEKAQEEERIAKQKADDQKSREAFRKHMASKKAKAPEKIEAPAKPRGKKAQRFTGKRKVRVTGAHGSRYKFVDWDEYCDLFELGILLFDMYDDGIYGEYFEEPAINTEDVFVTNDEIPTASESVSVNDTVHIASPVYEPPVETSPTPSVDTSYSSSSYSSSDYSSSSSSSYDSGSSCDCGGGCD